MLARLREMDDDIYAKASFGAGVFFVVFYVGYLAGTHPPYDAFGYLIGRDFVNTWMGAQAALHGEVHRLFDFPVYSEYLHAVFPTLPKHNWSYPPDLLLFIWPFAFLPYLGAYALWCAAGLGVYLGVAHRLGISKKGLVFLLVGPAVAINLFAGQNGFFTAALLIGGLSLLDRRPLAAGICFGLLTIKPQLGLLIPLALLLEGRWRTIAAASVTFATLFVVTCAVFGVSVWSDYFALAVPFQTQVMNHGSGMIPVMMPTAFMNARVVGLPHTIAFYVQLPFTLLAMAAVVWTFIRRRDPVLSRAVLVTAIFVVTPYAFNYDMAVFGWLVWTLRERFSAPGDTRLLLIVWTLPVTEMLMGLAHLPGSALVLPALLLRLVWMLKHDEEAAVGLKAPAPAAA